MIGNTRWSMMPPVVKNLLIINVLMFLAAITFEQSFGLNLWDLLGLHYFESEKFKPFQFVTYMFMHGGFDHIFFNMFAVWMFGTAIENAWGSKRFLIYYLLTGFGAAFLHYFFIYMDLNPMLDQLDALAMDPTAQEILAWANSASATDIFNSMRGTNAQELFIQQVQTPLNASPDNQQVLRTAADLFRDMAEFLRDQPNVVGASGSLFGILLAFGMMFPNARLMLLFPPIPLKAKYLVIGYGAIELFSAFQNNPNDNVAHIAHLGGMLFGFIIIKIWEKSGIRWR